MRLRCRVGWHSWKKPRRVKGFLRRKCALCPTWQMQDFPGGGWVRVSLAQRVRKPKLHPLTPAEEQTQDVERGQSA